MKFWIKVIVEFLRLKVIEIVKWVVFPSIIVALSIGAIYGLGILTTKIFPLFCFDSNPMTGIMALLIISMSILAIYGLCKFIRNNWQTAKNNVRFRR